MVYLQQVAKSYKYIPNYDAVINVAVVAMSPQGILFSVNAGTSNSHQRLSSCAADEGCIDTDQISCYSKYAPKYIRSNIT